MPTRVLYHCPCSTDFSSSFGPVQPSSSSHQLPALYFCEECNSIRCDQCTTKDLTAYYCPNCLFDVPLASVKTERAKCPRNCFSCPLCTSTLNVVASDSDANVGHAGHWNPLTPEASMGEPPWYLACPTCRWDSKEAGLTFEKPTGLSLQIQRIEDNAADVHEYNQLRAHFDTYLRVSSDPVATSLAAARSSKLLRDVPSLANDPLFAHNRKGQRNKVERDDKMPPYSAAMTWDAGRNAKRYVGVQQDVQDGKPLGAIGRREQNQLEFIQEQGNGSSISSLEQRWTSPANQSVRLSDLGPCRMPLRTKQTKRCSVCRHIIIRPDSKATSSRFKIRLLALNHLPEIQIRPPNTTVGTSAVEDRRRSAFASMGRRRVIAVDCENLYAGRTYIFEASFFNPLDDPMVVRLHIARPPPVSQTVRINNKTSNGKAATMLTSASSKFQWTVAPTSSQFHVSAFNAVWELDEEDNDLLETNRNSRQADDLSDEDVLNEEEEGDLIGDDREHKRSRTDIGGQRENRKKGQGILRRKGHETVVGLELALSRDAVGEVEFPMQVTFTYRPDAEGQQQRGASSANDGNKSFSFWTFVRLGRVTGDGKLGIGGESGHSYASSPSGPSSMMNATEARRSALDKRRSVMGMNLAGLSSLQTPSSSNTAAEQASNLQPPSPLSSLKEATIAADQSPTRRSSYGPQRRASTHSTTTTQHSTEVQIPGLGDDKETIEEHGS